MRQAYDYWQNQPGNYREPARRSARADPPKEASCTRQGDAKAPPAEALNMPKASTAPATDSIAPTEFPKRWSATSHAQRCRRSISVACTPQEEKTYASSHAFARKLRKAIPKDLVNIWQSQPSTDPKWCPLKISTGLRFLRRAQVRYRGHRLHARDKSRRGPG